MTKIDELQNMVNESFGKDTVILESNNNTVLVRYKKGDRTEYSVLRYNEKGCYGGRYYSTVNQSQETARESAWETYEQLTQ